MAKPKGRINVFRALPDEAAVNRLVGGHLANGRVLKVNHNPYSNLCVSLKKDRSGGKPPIFALSCNITAYKHMLDICSLLTGNTLNEE